jgi:hypothetical protein
LGLKNPSTQARQKPLGCRVMRSDVRPEATRNPKRLSCP